MSKEKVLFDIRKKYMSNRKVVCTGNPDRSGTLASGFKKIFPDAIFLCRTTGWDLTLQTDEQTQKLKEVFSKCNTFLNCSYIKPNIQKKLLEICNDSVKFCDVINIGSTHEYDELGKSSYQNSKMDLRKCGLSLNTFRFSVSHVILGGIKNTDEEHKKDWLEIDLICREIVDIWDKPYNQPIKSIDQFKTPW